MSAKKVRGENKAVLATGPARSLPVPRELGCLLAWLVPGAGHFLLGYRHRALGFFFLVMFSLVVGCQVGGDLPWIWSGSPLLILATLGAMGAGLPFLVVHFVLDYHGLAEAPGFEYGRAFIITAGLMNLLVILDVWDISSGTKE
jgi:hypothetical protein